MSAALLMGACSFLAAGGLAAALGLFGVIPSPQLVRAARSAHRGYGRYAAFTGMLEWAQGALPFVVVPVVAGLGEAAHLRAAYNLAMPALQAGAAITVMMVPALVASATRAATAWRSGRLLLACAVLYGLAVGLAGAPAMNLLYGGLYDAGPAVRWALAVLPAASVLAGMMVALLRARESPRAVLTSRLLAAIAGAPILIVLTAWAGVAGALAAACLTLIAEAGLLALHLNQPPKRANAPHQLALEPALVP
jgi:O-antigen/teichoic acid export membrane protein